MAGGDVPSLIDPGPTPPQNDPNHGKDSTIDSIFAGVEDREAPASTPSQQLQFQEFKPSVPVQAGSMMHGDIEAQPSPMPSTTHATTSSPSDTDALMGAGEDTAATAPIYSILYYQQFFDVDTTDVASRLTKAMMPFSTKFIEEVAPNPDLYGPFWVCTTLVFSMAAAGNFANYLGSSGTTAWHYDFNKMTIAAGVIYGYALCVPLGINFTAMYFTEAVGFIQLVCVYGYSLFVFVIVSYLCIIPSELVRWLLVVGAFVVSGGVIWGNIGGRLENLIPGKGQAVTGGLVLLHAVLALVFKLYFFEYQY